MSDAPTIFVALIALWLAIAAGALYWPRPPALDGERWFKVSLATVLRGQVEAVHGDVAAWESLVRRFVPYNPAGRMPELKVANPALVIPANWLPGERALHQQLSRTSAVTDRWNIIYADPAGVEARLVDPADLGVEYDPGSLCGRDCGWDQLAEWGAGSTSFRRALLDRVGAKWVLIRGADATSVAAQVLDRAAVEVGGFAHTIDWPELESEAAVRRVAAAISALIDSWQDRVVLLCESEGTALAIRALAQDGALRDPVLAVVSIGGVIGGRVGLSGQLGERACEDWLGAWFTYGRLDSESVRLTPYMSVQLVDLSCRQVGLPGLPLANQRFPDPRDDGTLQTLESVDLGPLVVTPDLPLDQVARALIAVTGCWVLNRR